MSLELLVNRKRDGSATPVRHGSRQNLVGPIQIGLRSRIYRAGSRLGAHIGDSHWWLSETWLCRSRGHTSRASSRRCVSCRSNTRVARSAGSSHCRRVHRRSRIDLRNRTASLVVVVGWNIVGARTWWLNPCRILHGVTHPRLTTTERKQAQATSEYGRLGNKCSHGKTPQALGDEQHSPG